MVAQFLRSCPPLVASRSVLCRDRQSRLRRVRGNHFLPGGLYDFAALAALSAIDLNSAPVQALTVAT